MQHDHEPNKNLGNRVGEFGFLIGGALLVSLGMLLFLPGMVTYRGLNALDMGLFIALCLQAISYGRFRNRKNLALVWSMVLLGCLLKPILEVVAGGSLFVSNFGAGIEPSLGSHVFGILSAFAVLIGIYAWSRLWNRSDCSRSFRSHSSSEISISYSSVDPGTRLRRELRELLK